MKILKPLLMLSLVFMAGIAVGVLGTRSFIRKTINEIVRHPDAAANRMTVVREKMEHDLVSRLDLTPEQKKQVHEIFVESGEQLRSLHTEFQSRLQGVFRNAHLKIAEILTPEQREKFEKITRERSEMRGDKPFLRRPPGPGGPPPQRRD